MAPGRQVQGPAHLLHQQMDKAGADAVYATSTIVDRLGARAVPINIQIGAEAKFLGVIDLVTMRAILWLDEDDGAEYSVEEIPAELLETAKKARHDLIEAVADSDDVLLHLFLEGQEPTEEQLKAGIRKATIAMRYSRCCAARRSKTRACRRCWTGCRLPAQPARHSSHIGHDPENMAGGDRAQAGRRRAFLRARLQDHDRPVRRPTDLHPRLFGHAEDGRLGAETHARARPERIGRLLKMHANKRKEITEYRRETLRRGGAQEPDHRRYDLLGPSPGSA